VFDDGDGFPMALVTRISRAAMMGLAWGVVWVMAGLLPFRLIVGELDPEHIGGPLYAGFIGGALFSALAGLASDRCRLDELSASRAAALGALSGLFTGVLPFVIGDNGRYQNGWSIAIVATCATVAGIVAARHRRRTGSSFPAATVAAVVSGLLTGPLWWFLTTQDHSTRLLPVAVIGGISVLGALSAFASPLIARWLAKQGYGGQPASL
jgi:hypothetical protein